MNDFDKLELSTETIRELSADEMSHVAGGAPATTDCLTGMYPTINMPCPTVQECFQATSLCHGG
jgi:hypothetical protein